jgi:hypothetical protein
MNFYDMAEEENRLVQRAEAKHGEYFLHAAGATLVFSNLVGSLAPGRDFFYRFYGQAKKHHTLSLLSSLRRHRNQAKMDLRYYLEATVQAGFALANPDPGEYIDFQAQALVDPDKPKRRANAWLASNYPLSSAEIVRVKADINNQDAHINIAASHATFDYDPADGAIVTSFFDFDDADIVQADLLVCAQAGLVGFDLLLAIRDASGGFVESAGVVDQFYDLRDANDRLFQEALSKDRWAARRSPMT